MSQAGPAKPGWLAWLRLRHWAHFLLLPLAGVDPGANYELMLGAVLRGVALAFALLGFGYLLNGLSDRAVDRDPLKSLPKAGWRPWLLLGPLLALFAPLLLQNQLVHEAADAPDDRAAGIATTFVRFGVAKTALLAGLCGLLAAAVLTGVLRGALRWPLGLVWLALFGLWIPLQLRRHGAQPAQMARLRLQQRWLALAAGGVACWAVLVLE